MHATTSLTKYVDGRLPAMYPPPSRSFDNDVRRYRWDPVLGLQTTMSLVVDILVPLTTAFTDDMTKYLSQHPLPEPINVEDLKNRYIKPKLDEILRLIKEEGAGRWIKDP